MYVADQRNNANYAEATVLATTFRLERLNVLTIGVSGQLMMRPHALQKTWETTTLKEVQM